MAACATIHPAGGLPGTIKHGGSPRPGGLGEQLGAGAPAPLRQGGQRALPGPLPTRMRGFQASWRPGNDSSRHLILARRSVVTFLAKRPLGRPAGPPVGPFCQKSYQPLYRASNGCSGRQRGTRPAKAGLVPSWSMCSPGAFPAHYSGPLRAAPLHEVIPGTSPGPASCPWLLKGTSLGGLARPPSSLQVVWSGAGPEARRHRSGLCRGLLSRGDLQPVPGLEVSSARRYRAAWGGGPSLLKGRPCGPAPLPPVLRLPVALFLRKRNKCNESGWRAIRANHPAKLDGLGPDGSLAG